MSLADFNADETNLFDRRLERVVIRSSSYDTKPSPGTLFFRNVDELERLANLVMMGLQHERDCLRKDQP